MDGTIQAFLKYLEEKKGRSQNTLTAYRSDLMQFKQTLDSMRVGTIELQDLSDLLLGDYLTWLQGAGYRASTVARKWAVVQSFLQYLRGSSLVSPKLGDGLQLKTEPRKRPRLLKRSDVEMLLATPLRAKTPMGIRDHALLAILYATGIRIGDLVALDLSSVDLVNGLLVSIGSDKKDILLGNAADGVLAYLREGRPHLAREHTEQALFLNQRGKRLSRQGLWLIVKRWALAAGLGDDISPHTLRHSLAHHMLQAGMSRKSVQRKLFLRSPNSLRVFIQPRGKASDP